MQINSLNCKWTLTHIFFLLFFSDEKLGYYVNCFWRDFLLLKKKLVYWAWVSNLRAGKQMSECTDGMKVENGEERLLGFNPVSSKNIWKGYRKKFQDFFQDC